MGFLISERDLGMVHGRCKGIGPKPMVAVDVFRIAEGRIAEHWDVLQEEVTMTVSGNSMFDPSEEKEVPSSFDGRRGLTAFCRLESDGR